MAEIAARGCCKYVHTSENIFQFSNLEDDFIQSDLQMRTMEAIKIHKRAKVYKCYNKRLGYVCNPHSLKEGAGTSSW